MNEMEIFNKNEMNLKETLFENLNPKELEKIETDTLFKVLKSIEDYSVSYSDGLTVEIQADGCSVDIDEIFELSIDRTTVEWTYFNGEQVDPYIAEFEEWKKDNSFLKGIVIDNIHNVKRIKA